MARTWRVGTATMVLALTTGAWARSQSLPVSDPREILARDPAVFIRLLDDVRPLPVTPETRQMVVMSLGPKLKARAPNARDRAKLAALDPVLRAVQREGVYEIRVIEIPSAAVAIDGRAVILVSQRALGLLEADELRAAVAHEAAHEYVWGEWESAAQRADWKRLQQLELLCDGIAMVTLHNIGSDTSSLIKAAQRLTSSNLLWLGAPPNPERYPMLSERREFAREVAKWITGQSGKEVARPPTRGR
jgi:hypothetical protein